MSHDTRPPRLAQCILSRVLDPNDRQCALADLDDEFEARSYKDGRGAARRWYRSQMLRSVVPALRHRFSAPKRRRDAQMNPTAGGGITRSIRFASRRLVRSPGYTLMAVASLAIGIGANTTIFGAANALMFAPISGLESPERLVDLGSSRDGSGFDTMSYPTFVDLAAAATPLNGVYAVDAEPRAVGLGTEEGAERLYGQLVSANYFGVLGVRPAAGQFFRGEDAIGTPLQQVVLSHGLWQRHFGGRAGIAGESVFLNGRSFLVVGVAPAGFQGTTLISPDLWVPLGARGPGLATDAGFSSRRSNWLVLGGRLGDGVTVARAQAAMGAAHDALAAADPGTYDGMALVVRPMGRLPGVGSPLPVFGMLMALVSIVLLIACANLASLMLARATARSRDTAVQLALGASRRQVFTETLVESVLLFTAGGVAGLMLSMWMTSALWALLPPLPVPIQLDFVVDLRVFAFVAALSLVAALLTAAVPAWQATRSRVGTALTQSSSRTSSRQRSRQIFVVAQMALCMLLITVAGLFARALSAGLDVDPGFDLDPIVVADVDLSLAGHGSDDRLRIVGELRDRLAALPGVTQAAVGAVVPLEGRTMGLGGLRPPGADQSTLDAAWNVVDPNYLPALDITMLRGRNFTAGDRTGAPGVAIIDEQLAAEAWPNEDAIGQTLLHGDFGPNSPAATPLTVVGVVGNVMARSLGERAEDRRGLIYVPLAQHPRGDVSFFVRRQPGASATRPLNTDIRSAIAGVDRNLPVVRLAEFRQIADVSLLPQRLATTIAGSLGLVGLLLGAIGVFGITTYFVAERTKELGIRMALGADRGFLQRMVLKRAARLGLLGGAVGVAAAVAIGRLLTSLLYGVSSFDPPTYAVTALVLMAVTVGAAWVPAYRATRVDPLIAMRVD